jgi:hypothetical protein
MLNLLFVPCFPLASLLLRMFVLACWRWRFPVNRIWKILPMLFSLVASLLVCILFSFCIFSFPRYSSLSVSPFSRHVQGNVDRYAHSLSIAKFDEQFGEQLMSVEKENCRQD